MIQPVVEGFGEVKAFSALLGRLIHQLDVQDVHPHTEIRVPLGKLKRKSDFQHYLEVARQKGANAIFVLFDADGNCAHNLVTPMYEWAKEACPDLPHAVVMARQEYEAWFLGGIESLWEIRGIKADAAYPGTPETKKDAKGELRKLQLKGFKYNPPADQAELSRRVNLGYVYLRCPSFRKLTKEVCRVLEELGNEPRIPPEWTS